MKVTFNISADFDFDTTIELPDNVSEAFSNFNGTLEEFKKSDEYKEALQIRQQALKDAVFDILDKKHLITYTLYKINGRNVYKDE